MRQNVLNIAELTPDAVLSFADWLKLVGISKPTGLRMRARGDAPRFVRISPYRIGTTVAEHRAWLASRTEAECRYEADLDRRKKA
jgi:predicted DNA-binding transcriptional regulator AlpA